VLLTWLDASCRACGNQGKLALTAIVQNCSNTISYGCANFHTGPF
jgi:hypothetical protein